MAMLSFRVDGEIAAEAQRWAERLGVGRSALLREALRRHLRCLAGEDVGASCPPRPPEGERTPAEIVQWGPAGDPPAGPARPGGAG